MARADTLTPLVTTPDSASCECAGSFSSPLHGHHDAWHRCHRAFRLIAELGARAFYNGAVGEALLKTSHQLGGTMTASDLRNYDVEWVQPISTDYRGWKVSELPPNGQGIGTLEMLNILENFPIGQYEQTILRPTRMATPRT
jgi:gamma-glutamyltranspeptidase